jgi:hypothetical protein
MNDITRLLFIINISWIIVHELDAIQQHEWRFFFMRIPISDQFAYQIFTALHIPLLVFMLWNINAQWFQVGLDLFLIGHAGVHLLLRHHPLIQFNQFFSRIWIFGGAILGAIHLILLSL